MAILRQQDRTRAKGVKLCGLSSLVVLAFCAFAQAPVLHFPLPAYLGTLLAITFLAENPIKVSPKRMEMLSA